MKIKKIKNNLPKFLNRAIGVHSEADLLKIRKGRVAIVGMGCDGCEVAEQLIRTGVGELTIIDMDVVEETNLNRQRLYCLSDIGKTKVLSAMKRLRSISRHTKIKAIYDELTYENGENYLKDHNVIIQGLDSISARITAHEIAGKLKIPIVTMSGQAPFRTVVSTVMPGGPTYQELFTIPIVKPIREMTKKEKGEFNFKLCCKRAKHALEHGADKEWYNRFIIGKAGWSITLGRSPITGTLQANEVMRLLSGKEPIAKAPKIIAYDYYGLAEFGIPESIVALLTPLKEKYWDYRIW